MIMLLEFTILEASLFVLRNTSMKFSILTRDSALFVWYSDSFMALDFSRSDSDFVLVGSRAMLISNSVIASLKRFSFISAFPVFICAREAFLFALIRRILTSL